jgi:hypothetical protein
MGTGFFPGVNCGRGLLLTTHPLLAPKSLKHRAIPLTPPLWATIVPVTELLYLTLNPFIVVVVVVVVDDDDDNNNNNIKWALYLYKSQDFNYRFDHLHLITECSRPIYTCTTALTSRVVTIH